MGLQKPARFVLLTTTLLTAAAQVSLERTTPVAAQAAPPVFGISGRTFTRNANPQFMLFFSYFAALRPDNATPQNLSDTQRFEAYADNTLNEHFRLLRAYGFDGVRIFPNWWWSASSSGCSPDLLPVIGTNGMINETAWARLVKVLQLAGNNGLFVDVSWARDTIGPNVDLISQYGAGLLRATDRLRGTNPHVFFDIQNEHNVGGSTHPCKKNSESAADIRTMIDALQNTQSCYQGIGCGDSNRVMFASVDGGIARTGANSVAAHASGAHMDAIAYHDPREAGSAYLGGYEDLPLWAELTGWRVWEIKTDATLKNLVLPVYFQEPAFYGSGYACVPQFHDCSPSGIATQFLQAAGSARGAGAAAWTLHSEGFFKNYGAAGAVNAVELSFIQRIAGWLSSPYSTPWNPHY